MPLRCYEQSVHEVLLALLPNYGEVYMWNYLWCRPTRSIHGDSTGKARAPFLFPELKIAKF
jgi:hypothetical protein